MTEKRFTKVENIFDIGDEGVKDNQTKIEYYYALDMIELLNKQNEQIDFLANILSELSAYMIALGFDIELEYKDGRTINLTDVGSELYW